MKKALFTFLLVLLFGVFALAQGTQDQQTTPSNPDTSVQNPDQSQPSPTNPATNPDVNKTPDQQTSPQATPETLPQSDQNKAEEKTTASNKHEKSITGCLEKSPEGGNTFALVTKKGKRTIEVIPDTTLQASISDHVGHKVRLSGEWGRETASEAGSENESATAGSQPTTSASASNPSNPANPNETGNLPQSDQPNATATQQSNSTSPNAEMNRNERVFRADKLEHISETCNAGSSNTNQTQPQSQPQ